MDASSARSNEIPQVTSSLDQLGGDGTIDDRALLLQHRSFEDSLHYEELINPSRDSVTCQTCQGLGRVPRERTNELIALVPYNDERLKPKRTKCIVLSISVLLFMAFIVTSFFGMPRYVSLVETALPQKTNATVAKETMELKLDLASFYQVGNENYYPIDLVSLDMKIMWQNYIVKNVTLLNTTYPSITVKPRDQQNITIEVYDIFFGESNHLDFLVYHCVQPYHRFNTISLQFQTTANVSYWYGRYELIQKESSHWVRCESTIEVAKISNKLLTDRKSYLKISD